MGYSIEQLDKIMANAVIAYDIKESKKKYYNRYALGQYLQRKEEVTQDIIAGADIRMAINAGFTGKLAESILKAVGLQVDYSRIETSFYYKPVALKAE